MTATFDETLRVLGCHQTTDSELGVVKGSISTFGGETNRHFSTAAHNGVSGNDFSVPFSSWTCFDTKGNKYEQVENTPSLSLVKEAGEDLLGHAVCVRHHRLRWQATVIWSYLRLCPNRVLFVTNTIEKLSSRSLGSSSICEIRFTRSLASSCVPRENSCSA